MYLNNSFYKAGIGDFERQKKQQANPLNLCFLTQHIFFSMFLWWLHILYWTIQNVMTVRKDQIIAV